MRAVSNRPTRVQRITTAALIGGACASLAGCSSLPGDDDGGRFPSREIKGGELPRQAQATTVERVVDGDTVELQGLGSSRLIGVDTPETYEGQECFGAEASRFTERTLKPGLRVRVLHGREPEDDYGRDLVYLWLSDGRLFNAILTKRGFAEPLTIAPNDDLAGLFERTAQAAGAAGRGLWGACPASG